MNRGLRCILEFILGNGVLLCYGFDEGVGWGRGRECTGGIRRESNDELVALGR